MTDGVHGRRIVGWLACWVLAACGGAPAADATAVASATSSASSSTVERDASSARVPSASASPSSASPSSASPAEAPATVSALLTGAQGALAARRWDDAAALLARARSAAKGDELRKVRYYEATLAAYRQDLPQSLALLGENLAEAPVGEPRFWTHNQRTWVRWAAKDVDGALAEVAAAEASLEAVADAKQADLLRLHVLWDRAYLQLEKAKTPKERAGAEETRRAFEALAKKTGNLAGVEVLRAWFESARGNVASARAAVVRAGLDHTDDMQDVFVGGATLLKAGDPAGAEVYFRRVRESQDAYLMHGLLLARVPPPPAR